MSERVPDDVPVDVPVEIESLEEHEPMQGFHGRFVHSATMTHAYWRIDQGAQLPEHSHPQKS